ncbi:MAG: UDP-N-acetylmuramate dehydrogenase [Candidatus Saccharimonadales bacterium]
MNILENVSLAEYSTMGLGGAAAYLTEVNSRDEVAEAVAWARERELPIIMIGGGSNIVWKDEGFSGLLIVNKIMGYEVQEEGEDFIVVIGAGEHWDSVVDRTVKDGLTGIEALSLVPGSAGATPIQNVGAYGQEISETLVSLEAYDTLSSQFVTLEGSECDFSYRDSRFKKADRGRYLITSITLQLKKDNPKPPFYASVQAYFQENNVTNFTPAALREAVIAIRTAKLPDPAVVRNTGSFFANAVIDNAKYEVLAREFPDLPHWPMSNGMIKLSSAWLIEQAGFKDYHDPETGMATWPRQPLVLVNETAKSTADLLTFKQKIVSAVQTKFGIELVQEPEMLP